MKRPSCRAASNPARVSSFRWKESVAGAISTLAAMSPTQRPSGPRCTSSRKMARRASWARAARLAIAVFDSIFLVLSKYRNLVKPPAVGQSAAVLRSLLNWRNDHEKHRKLARNPDRLAHRRRRRSAAISVQAGEDRRGLRPGRRLRFHRAGHRAEADRAPGDAGDRRESPRSGQRPRLGVRDQVPGGRLHAAAHASELHRQSERVQVVVRSDRRHHPHRSALARPLRGRGAPFGSGKDSAGAGGARQKGPGQARLCFERKRKPRARGDRIPSVHGEDKNHACSLQGNRPGAQRHDRRKRSDDPGQRCDGPAARQVRTPEGARGHHAQAHRSGPRRPHGGRVGIPELRGHQLARPRGSQGTVEVHRRAPQQGGQPSAEVAGRGKGSGRRRPRARGGLLQGIRRHPQERGCALEPGREAGRGQSGLVGAAVGSTRRAGVTVPVDTLTHALSGALLARATAPEDAPPRSLPRRVAAGFFACAAPDLDFVVAFAGPVEYLANHRGVTHSLVLLPLWALAVSWVLAKILREPRGWRALYGVTAIGLALHIAGDVITSYGTVILAPFSDWRAQIGTTFIIDLWFSGIIAAGLAASAVLRRSRWPAGAASALLAGYVGFQYLQKERALEFGGRHARALGLRGSTVNVQPRP